jgi:outer membrane protein OmpA-like peptidoglycan-associated protein
MDGDKVADPARAGRLLDRKLDRFTKDLNQADAGGSGFSLYRALRVGADKAAQTRSPVEVWLPTTVLAGTTDPLSIARLTDAEVDPSQAVDELMNGSLKNLDMTMVTPHIVMLTPVGQQQQQLSPCSEHWRATFITNLAEQLGAEVADVVPDNSIEPPWRDSSEVPAIKPMVDKIPPPPPPGDPVKRPKPPRIDNASFQPNSATLIDRDATRAAVSQMITFQRANDRRYRISVIGYCARFGDADGARETCRERADAIAGLLRDGGVRQADIDTDGKGCDERADPAQDPRSPARQRWPRRKHVTKGHAVLIAASCDQRGASRAECGTSGDQPHASVGADGRRPGLRQNRHARRHTGQAQRRVTGRARRRLHRDGPASLV